MAANFATADPTPNSHVQRIPFGALVLYFMAKIVVTASLWLLDAVEKGWNGFSNARVIVQTET